MSYLIFFWGIVLIAGMLVDNVRGCNPETIITQERKCFECEDCPKAMGSSTKSVSWHCYGVDDPTYYCQTLYGYDDNGKWKVERRHATNRKDGMEGCNTWGTHAENKHCYCVAKKQAGPCNGKSFPEPEATTPVGGNSPEDGNSTGSRFGGKFEHFASLSLSQALYWIITTINPAIYQ